MRVSRSLIAGFLMMLTALPAMAAAPNDWIVNRVNTKLSATLMLMSELRAGTITRTQDKDGPRISVAFLVNNAPGLGTCMISEGTAMLEVVGQLPFCNPDKPSTWSSHCTLPQKCPKGAPGNVYSFVCGENNSTCACTPSDSVGYYAPYCGDPAQTQTAPHCVPEPNNYMVPPTPLNAPALARVAAGLDYLAANPGIKVVPQDLAQAIDDLGNQTDGCHSVPR